MARPPAPVFRSKGHFLRQRKGGREEGGLGLCDAQKMVGPLSFGYTNIAWIRPEPGDRTAPLKRVRGIGKGNLMSAIFWNISSPSPYKVHMLNRMCCELAVCTRHSVGAAKNTLPLFSPPLSQNMEWMGVRGSAEYEERLSR